MKLGLPHLPPGPASAWTQEEVLAFLADFRRLCTLSPTYQCGRLVELLMADLIEALLEKEVAAVAKG